MLILHLLQEFTIASGGKWEEKCRDPLMTSETTTNHLKSERLTHRVPGPQLVLVSAHVPLPRPPERLRHRGEHAQR
jgi:hypothetical protein